MRNGNLFLLATADGVQKDFEDLLCPALTRAVDDAFFVTEVMPSGAEKPLCCDLKAKRNFIVN